MSAFHRGGERSSERGSGVSGLGAAGAAVSGAGAAAVATAASICCAGPVLAPLVVGLLGAGGAAWAAGLKPYAPWLLAVSLLFLAYGFWATHRRPATCGPGPKAPQRWLRRASVLALWLAAGLWLIAALMNLRLGVAS